MVALFAVVGGVAWKAVRWDILGYPPKVLLLLLMLASAAVGLARLRVRSKVPKRDASKGVSIAAPILVLGFLCMLGLELAGRGRPDSLVELDFPLSGRVFYVGQGGSSLTQNLHRLVRSQAGAIDIVALDDWGRRARPFWSTRLTDFITYASPVLAPCSGTVTMIETSEPDNVPGRMDFVSAPQGNCVVVFCGQVSVLLGHLQSGSLSVRVGQVVNVGDVVGLVGNSGNSSEPHLHVQAVRGRVTSLSELEASDPVGMLFPVGQFLVRGDHVDKRGLVP